MNQSEKLIKLRIANKNILEVLITLNPQSNLHQALSVASEQVAWVMQVEKRIVSLEVEVDNKTKSSGEKDLLEASIICGHDCGLPKGHLGNHMVDRS